MRIGPRRDGPVAAVRGPRVDGTDPPRLQHGVAFHRDAGHLLDRLVPLARAAVTGGGTVALALAPATERSVRAALGAGDATGALVTLAPPRPAEAGSGQSIALRRARELRGLVAVAGPLTVLAEHLPEHDGPDGRFWTELEAAEDIAMAELPVHLTCFYPEMPLHLSVLDGARRTHPRVLVDDELRDNPAHRPPRDVLADQPPAPPPLLGPPDHRMRFRAWQLREVRRLVHGRLVAAGLTPDRADDVVLAVNEVATNAVEHGADGVAELHLWCDAAGLTCEVHDTGTLLDPLPGLVAPPATDHRGRGLWIARQLCDLLHVWTDRRGTHVRLRCTP